MMQSKRLCITGVFLLLFFMSPYISQMEAHTTDGNKKGVIKMDRTFREEKNQKNNAQNQKNAQNKQQRGAQNQNQHNAQDKQGCCNAEDRK